MPHYVLMEIGKPVEAIQLVSDILTEMRHRPQDSAMERLCCDLQEAQTHLILYKFQDAIVRLKSALNSPILLSCEENQSQFYRLIFALAGCFIAQHNYVEAKSLLHRLLRAEFNVAEVSKKITMCNEALKHKAMTPIKLAEMAHNLAQFTIDKAVAIKAKSSTTTKKLMEQQFIRLAQILSRKIVANAVLIQPFDETSLIFIKLAQAIAIEIKPVTYFQSIFMEISYDYYIPDPISCYERIDEIFAEFHIKPMIIKSSEVQKLSLG